MEQPLHRSDTAPPLLAEALLRAAAELVRIAERPGFSLNAVRALLNANLGADVVTLWLLEDDGRLRVAASESHGAPYLDTSAGAALHPGEGAPGAALTAGGPLLLDSAGLRQSLRHLGRSNAAYLTSQAKLLPPAVAGLFLPLADDDGQLGVLELLDLDGDAPWSSETPLLAVFAEHFTVAARAAWSFGALRARQRRLEAVDAVARALAAAADLGEMLAATLAVALRLGGAERGLVALFDRQGAVVGASIGLGDAFPTGTQLDPAAPPFAMLDAGDIPIVALPEHEPWAALRRLGVEALALVPLPASGATVGALVLALPAGAAARLDRTSLLAISVQLGLAAGSSQMYDMTQRERRRLAGVIDSMAEGVLICDPEGRLVLSNHEAELLLGRALPAGLSLGDLAALLHMRGLDGQPLPVSDTPLAKALLSSVYRNYEVQVLGGAGSDIVIGCSGAPLLADDGSVDGAVVVFRDLTAAKRHAALRDEFVAVAAHELRAPLAAIKGYTDLLLQRKEHPDGAVPSERGLALLARQVDHLVQLVDNLLDVSRLDAGRLQLYRQPVDLMALLEASIERVRVGAGQHTWELRGPDELPILGDNVRLQQVFTNLLTNASRYSAAGTTVTVEVWSDVCAVDDDGVLGVGGDTPCAVVAVRDQGVGMPLDVQARVGDRYFRANTAAAPSGLGLGVYISREIVQLHGGRIWFESVPERGTSFYVMLPTNLDDAPEIAGLPLVVTPSS